MKITAIFPLLLSLLLGAQETAAAGPLINVVLRAASAASSARSAFVGLARGASRNAAVIRNSAAVADARMAVGLTRSLASHAVARPAARTFTRLRTFVARNEGNFVAGSTAGSVGLGPAIGFGIAKRSNDPAQDQVEKRDPVVDRVRQLSRDLLGRQTTVHIGGESTSNLPGTIELEGAPEPPEGVDQELWEDCFYSLSFSHAEATANEAEDGIQFHGMPPACIDLFSDVGENCDGETDCIAMEGLTEQEFEDMWNLMQILAEAVDEEH